MQYMSVVCTTRQKILTMKHTEFSGNSIDYLERHIEEVAEDMQTACAPQMCNANNALTMCKVKSGEATL